MPDRAKLYFTSRLAPQARNAEGLEATIQEFFGPTTEVQTFVGRWLSLPADSVCRLGESPSSGTLGSTAIAGARIWTSQLHFRVRLGPMKLVDFERLLPTGPSFRRLCDWIQLYTGQQYSWDAQIVLLKEEVPETRLGRNGRLGWTVWLKTKPMDHDPADLRLHPPGQT